MMLEDEEGNIPTSTHMSSNILLKVKGFNGLRLQLSPATLKAILMEKS
jgi:hypothetical protein